MRVAIIGGGIAGISAAYNLWKYSNGTVGITIYEASDSLGGHSSTVKHPDISRAIDVGFQVFNSYNYPLFCQFLQELQVDVCESNMSFSVQSDWTWSSRSTWNSFRNNPWKFMSLVYSLRQFYAAAKSFIKTSEKSAYQEFTIEEFVEKYNLPRHLLRDFIIPFAASVWSLPEDSAKHFDAFTMLTFMHNHKLLSFHSFNWKTVTGTSRDYIDKFLQVCQPDVILNTKVSSLEQSESGRWKINGTSKAFDHVIFACHGNEVQDIKIASNQYQADKIDLFVRDIRSIRYSSNILIIHTDDRLMPDDKDLWCSWNFASGVVTYWENSLQPLNSDIDVFTTLLHPQQLDKIEISDEKILCKREMSHPSDIAFNMAVGRKLKSAKCNLHACGGYMGYGFHEDAFRSGLGAALKVLNKQNTMRIIKYSALERSVITDIFTVPSRYILSKILNYNLKSISGDKCIGVQLPGKEIQFYGKKSVPSALVNIKTLSALSACILRGDIGFADYYMRGEIECDNLPLFFCSIIAESDNSWFSWMQDITTNCCNALSAIQYRLKVQNSAAVAKQNIAEHYDFGNDFFSIFLDKTMTYSSAIFEDENMSLTDAQMKKYNTLIKDLDIESTDHVLEIGTGWGFFACHLVKTCKCKVTTVTLSHQQALYAKQRFENEKLTDKITLLEADYRQITSLCSSTQFSVVVSIEMIEAVGHQNFDTYFRVINQCSTPSARIGIQAITRCEDNYDKYKNTPDFINKYIFPGGCLPSLGAISRHACRNGLTINKLNNISQSYAITLKKWRQNFLDGNKDKIYPGESRKWDLYFAICQAGFLVGKIQDYQIILSKIGRNKLN